MVAYDKETEQWGVGVASKFIAVGSVVPWVSAGSGAIATQAWANISYGKDGLKLLRTMGAEETVKKLTSADPEREWRQLGIVDSMGKAFTYTGKNCLEFAGGIAGEGFAVQGNILAGRKVIESMAAAMEGAGTLVERMIKALKNADSNGGDRRGRQSAAILVAGNSDTYDENTDRIYDIRVDEHTNPIAEIERITRVWDATFFPDEMLPLEPNMEEIRNALKKKGYKDLEAWAFDNNFDDKVKGGKIGRNVLEILKG